MSLAKKIKKVGIIAGNCDGFVGNTIMKFAEGCFSTFSEMIREKIMAKTRYKIGAGMIKPALDEIRNKLSDMGIEIEDTPDGTIWRNED